MQLGPCDAIAGKQSIERRIAKEIIERWLAPWLLHGVPPGYERRLTLSTPGDMTYGGQDLGHFVIAAMGRGRMGNCLSLFVTCLLFPMMPSLSNDAMTQITRKWETSI
jgi:hypothetical protein